MLLTIRIKSICCCVGGSGGSTVGRVSSGPVGIVTVTVSDGVDACVACIVCVSESLVTTFFSRADDDVDDSSFASCSCCIVDIMNICAKFQSLFPLFHFRVYGFSLISSVRSQFADFALKSNSSLDEFTGKLVSIVEFQHDYDDRMRIKMK